MPLSVHAAFLWRDWSGHNFGLRLARLNFREWCRHSRHAVDFPVCGQNFEATHLPLRKMLWPQTGYAVDCVREQQDNRHVMAPCLSFPHFIRTPHANTYTQRLIFTSTHRQTHTHIHTNKHLRKTYRGILDHRKIISSFWSYQLYESIDKPLSGEKKTFTMRLGLALVSCLHKQQEVCKHRLKNRQK